MAKILVIDDSRVQRSFVRFSCEDAGHEIIEAEDGPTGLQKATESDTDCALILLDLQMPEMSGQEVLQALRDKNCPIPVILLTAGDPQAVMEECLALGAVQVIEKPDDPGQLVDLIAAVLDG